MSRRFSLVWILFCLLPFAAVHAGYTVTSNAAISGHNKKKVTGGLDACKRACDNERTFLCKSFDYDKRKSSCDLSDRVATDVGGLKKDYPGNPYDHYARTLRSSAKDIYKQVESLTKVEAEEVSIGSGYATWPRTHIQGLAKVIGNYWIATHDKKGKDEGRLQVIDYEKGKIVHTELINFANEGFPAGAQGANDYFAVGTGNDRHVRFYQISSGESDTFTVQEVSNKFSPWGHFVESVGFARNPVDDRYYLMVTRKKENQTVLYKSNTSTLDQNTNWVGVTLSGSVPFGEAGIALIFEENTNNLFAFSLGAALGGGTAEDEAFAVTLIQFTNRTKATAFPSSYHTLRDGDGDFRWGGTVYVNDEGKLIMVATPRKVRSTGSRDFGVYTAK